VFESSTVGGRLKTVQLGGRKYESGGSIIHDANKYMVDMLEVCQLERKNPLPRETFSLGQKSIVFQEWGHSLLDKIRLALTFGPLQLWRLERFYLGVLDNFVKVYPALDEGEGFETVEDLLGSMSGEMVGLTQVNLEDHLLSLGIGPEVISQIVSVATKFNYGQLPSEVQAFLGAVSLIGFDKRLWAVAGGNEGVCRCLLTKSGAELVSKSVSRVERLEREEGFKVMTETGEQYFDVVILASPLSRELSSLEMRGPGGEYHRTVSTLVRGRLNVTGLGVTADHHLTSHYIYVSPDLPFWSVELMTPVDFEPSRDVQLSPVYRMFSHLPPSEETIAAVFSSVEELEQEDWLAYPRYSTHNNFTSFKSLPGLFYINTIEWAASAMEMSVIGAKNVVNLVKLYLDNPGHVLVDHPAKSEL